MAAPRLDMTREQILAFRRAVGALDERLPAGAESLRHAARAGLQDSMPRAALLSIHARVAGADSSAWEDPALVQVWGPRFSAYVVAVPDVAIFTLGRFPVDARGRARAETTASRLHDFLAGRRMTYGEAGHAMGIQPNALRYGTTTGRILIRWEGARQPVVWTIPPPGMSAEEARAELARRYLHVFGPSTATSFSRWAGMKPPGAKAAFEGLASSLVPVRTSLGDEWLLAEDEEAARAADASATGVDVARLLPSGDAYFLLQGRDREVLVPDPRLRALLWTPRVWPGAVLLGGEIVGVWRRANTELTIEPWRPLGPSGRVAVEAEASALPLPGLRTAIRVRWAT